MKKIIHRILAILPAVLIQLAWYYILLRWLAPYSALLTLLLSLLGFIYVMTVIVKNDDSTYKILWLLVLLIFPLPGALLYFLFGNKRTARPIQRRLETSRDHYLYHGPSAIEEIKEKNERLYQTLNYLSSYTTYPILRNEQATYYALGEEMFVDMLQAIRQAKSTIYCEYFIVEKGKMWDQMVELFEAKVKEGVQVYVMYDDLGSLSTFTKEEANELVAKGFHVHKFNELITIKGTLNYRDHRKMLIIDHQVAFSGGINLADEYINAYEKHGHWKDIGFKITGAGVLPYCDMFLKFWNAFSKETIDVEPVTDFENKEDDGYIFSYYDSPIHNTAVSNTLYIELLSQAKKYAYFYTPYLMLGDDLMDAFVLAAKRGVDVRIIMPGVPDKKIVFRMSRSFYQELLSAGVKIYEYVPGFVHAKASIVDDEICTIGTVNLDYRSLFLHFENNSLFYQSKVLFDLKQDFLNTQEKSKEIQPYSNKEYAKKWLIDGILRIFSPLC